MDEEEKFLPGRRTLKMLCWPLVIGICTCPAFLKSSFEHLGILILQNKIKMKGFVMTV